MSKVVFFPDNENFKNRNFPMVHRMMREFGLHSIFDNPPEVKNIRFYLKGFENNFEKAIIENRYIYNIDLFEIVGAEYRRYINARSLNESITFKWSDILKCRLCEEEYDKLTMTNGICRMCMQLHSKAELLEMLVE